MNEARVASADFCNLGAPFDRVTFFNSDGVDPGIDRQQVARVPQHEDRHAVRVLRDGGHSSIARRANRGTGGRADVDPFVLALLVRSNDRSGDRHQKLAAA